jgi:hypothetical protein
VAPLAVRSDGAEARAILNAAAAGEEPVDIFCLEGSVIHGPNGTGGFHIMAGTGRPMREMIEARPRAPMSRWALRGLWRDHHGRRQCGGGGRPCL